MRLSAKIRAACAPVIVVGYEFKDQILIFEMKDKVKENREL